MSPLAWVLLGAGLALQLVGFALAVLLAVLMRRHGWPPPGWRQR